MQNNTPTPICSGKMVQYAKNGRKRSDLWDPMLGFLWRTSKRFVPDTLAKFSAAMHLWQSSMPWASESSMPLALQLLTVQIFISLSMSHLGLWGPDLSDGNCKVPHFSRAGLLWQELISVFCHHYQCPLMLAGQSFLMPCWELCACDGNVHCQIAYWSACDGRAHSLGWPVCHPAKVVCWLLLFHQDKLILVRLCGWLLGGQPAAAADDYISATSHRPHIGHQFSVVMGFRLSPSVGVSLSCTGPMAVDRDKGNGCWWMMFITLDQGMAQKTLIYKLTWFVIKEGREALQIMNTLWCNDKWHLSNRTWDIKLNSIKEYINQLSFYLFTTV